MSNLIKVEISEEDWESLVESHYCLQALDCCGIGNWSKAGKAFEIFKDLIREDSDNLLKHLVESTKTIH